jgi:poly(hydroxyalkanoate) granule-associated protein
LGFNALTDPTATRALHAPAKEHLMIKKVKPASSDTDNASGTDSQLAAAVKASAQQIWLAGLGAFAKAQEEGVKVFDALVTEGKTLHKRTRHLSDGRLDEVSGKVGKVASDLSKQATQSWDRLEQVFEERVARALGRLGVPSSAEVNALAARVEALNDAVRNLGVKTPAAKPAARKASVRAKAPAAPASAARQPARRAASPARKASAKVAAGRK